MLLDTVRQELTTAMKNGDNIKKSTLRLVLSEAGLVNSSEDDDIIKIMRKMVERNRETLTFVQNDETAREKLEKEIAILQHYIPKTLNITDVQSALTPIHEDIRSCSKEGAAVGLAMKYLKSVGLQVDGKDVKQVVLELRDQNDK